MGVAGRIPVRRQPIALDEPGTFGSTRPRPRAIWGRGQPSLAEPVRGARGRPAKEIRCAPRYPVPMQFSPLR